MNKIRPLKNPKKNIPLKHENPVEKERLQGTLGGEIGFGDLESARDWIDANFHPWNQEEFEIVRERILKERENRHKSKKKARK